MCSLPRTGEASVVVLPTSVQPTSDILTTTIKRASIGGVETSHRGRDDDAKQICGSDPHRAVSVALGAMRKLQSPKDHFRHLGPAVDYDGHKYNSTNDEDADEDENEDEDEDEDEDEEEEEEDGAVNEPDANLQAVDADAKQGAIHSTVHASQSTTPGDGKSIESDQKGHLKRKQMTASSTQSPMTVTKRPKRHAIRVDYDAATQRWTACVESTARTISVVGPGVYACSEPEQGVPDLMYYFDEYPASDRVWSAFFPSLRAKWSVSDPPSANSSMDKRPIQDHSTSVETVEHRAPMPEDPPTRPSASASQSTPDSLLKLHQRDWDAWLEEHRVSCGWSGAVCRSYKARLADLPFDGDRHPVRASHVYLPSYAR